MSTSAFFMKLYDLKLHDFEVFPEKHSNCAKVQNRGRIGPGTGLLFNSVRGGLT